MATKKIERNVTPGLKFTCKGSCGKKVTMDQLQKIDGKRLDICIDCYEAQITKTTGERKMAKTKSTPTTNTPVAKKEPAKNIEQYLADNAKEILEALMTTTDLTEFYLASGLSKKKIVKMFLGKDDKGYVRILNTCYFGGTYATKLKDEEASTAKGKSILKVIDTVVTPIAVLVETAYNELPNKKVGGARDEKLEELTKKLSAEEILKYFPRYKKEKVLAYYQEPVTA